MTIHKAKSGSYATVTAAATADYIEEYAAKIYNTVKGNREKLPECNKAQLNAIAAELETVHKRLLWILDGKY